VPQITGPTLSGRKASNLRQRHCVHIFAHLTQAPDRQGKLLDYRDSRFLHGEKRDSAAKFRVRADKRVKCIDRAAIMAG
jgi:hypothetical protein